MPPPTEYPCRFEAEGHVYRSGDGVHPSVTQVLDKCGCSDFSMVDPWVLEAARVRGTEVHRLTVEWDGVRAPFKLEYFLEDVPEALHGYLYQYEAFLTEMGFEANARETERPRIVEVHGHKLAMTPDRIGHFIDSPRITTILDLKTGGELFSHPLQLAAYSMGIERVLSLAMAQMRVALYLEPDAYRLKIYRQPQDYFAFMCALDGGGPYLDNWKQQRQRSLVR